jgi:uncharacterized YigZ family protein
MVESGGPDRTSAYKTLCGEGTSERTIERSRFLGHASPVESEEEANAFVEALRDEHYDARHVCYGLRLGRGAQSIDRSNDDGEPPRTGGFPIWQVLDGEDITDAIAVVVRYYGGVKLGPGGLARAYRDTARDAIEAAGIVKRFPETRVVLQVPYQRHGEVEHFIDEDAGVRLIDEAFTDDVSLTLAVRLQDLDEVRDRLAGLLNRAPESLFESG